MPLGETTITGKRSTLFSAVPATQMETDTNAFAPATDPMSLVLAVAVIRVAEGIIASGEEDT
jgi:hypothetical protein